MGDREFQQLPVQAVRACNASLISCAHRQFRQNGIERLVEDRVHHGEKAHQEQIVRMRRHSRERRQQLAESPADERHGHQFIGFSIRQHADRNHRDPFPEFAFAEQGKGVRDGVDFRAEAEGRGVEVSQQPERKGSFVLDFGGQFLDVEFGSGRRVQEFEVGQFEGRQRAMLHHFGAAEKIALEQRVSHFHGRRVFLLGFHFFGQHADVFFRVPGNKRALFLPVGEAEIHLDDVGERDQRSPVGRIHEIIERDRVSRLLQAPAGVDDFLVGIDVFENFDHHRIGREKRNIVPKQKIPGTVDEHAVSRR